MAQRDKQTDRQTDRQTDGHGDSMTNSAQWGRVREEEKNQFIVSKCMVI